MGEKTHTSESTQTERTDEKIDMRKMRKRLTTADEIKEIHDNRKKYKEEDLREKMQRISDQLRECGKL